MNKDRCVLLTCRNRVPLAAEQIRRVTNTFMGLDPTVNVRYDPASPTIFHPVTEASGEVFGEIVFGPDIFPGQAVDPNSSLSLTAAVAHELTHYYRWRDQTQLSGNAMTLIDEALTSFEATQRFERQLMPHDIRQLISDGIQRIGLYIQSLQR